MKEEDSLLCDSGEADGGKPRIVGEQGWARATCGASTHLPEHLLWAAWAVWEFPESIGDHEWWALNVSVGFGLVSPPWTVTCCQEMGVARLGADLSFNVTNCPLVLGAAAEAGG